MVERKGLLVGAGISIGGAAALVGANTVLAAAAAPLWSVLPGDAKRYSWRDGEISYAVRGTGTPILLLHGIYASACGYEMRRLFAPFAQSHRVYCPDLIGFGLSDRPAIDYTPVVFMQMIRDFVQDVIGRSCIVIASSLTAAYVIQLGFDHPGLFRRLVLSTPAGLEQLADRTASAGKTAGYTLLKSPVIGQALFNALVSKPSLRHYLRNQVYFNPDAVDEEMVAYYHASAHQKNARFAPAAFVARQLNWPVRHAYAKLTQPVTIVWGVSATIAPIKYAQTFRKVNRVSRLELLDRCGALPHDEQAEAFISRVRDWLALPDEESRWCEPVVERDEKT